MKRKIKRREFKKEKCRNSIGGNLNAMMATYLSRDKKKWFVFATASPFSSLIRAQTIKEKEKEKHCHFDMII